VVLLVASFAGKLDASISTSVDFRMADLLQRGEDVDAMGQLLCPLVAGGIAQLLDSLALVVMQLVRLAAWKLPC
jgi:hypothetical protein